MFGLVGFVVVLGLCCYAVKVIVGNLTTLQNTAEKKTKKLEQSEKE